MNRLPGAVLFACTKNSIRSPIAEGLLKHLMGHRIYVDSAGAREGEIDPFAVAVMDEIGIDISRHKSKTFDQLEDDSFDLIIVEGNREQRMEAYRQVRDQLMKRIKERFPPDLKPMV
jgi:protein-tyrosine-phosphatase